MKVPEPKKTKGGWRIQLRLGGKSIPVIAADRKSCIRAAAQIKADWQSGSYKVTVIDSTISEAVSKYIEAREAVLSPSTIRSYRIIEKNRWQAVKHRKLSDIKPAEWQRIVSAEARACSPKTLKNAFGLLKSAARYAGYPLPDDIRLPQPEHNERAYLLPDDIPIFVAAVKDTKYAVPLLLALSSMRISEISALRWENIPSNPKLIHTNGAVVLGSDNRYKHKRTNKNSSSNRSIPIFIPELSNAIKRDRQPTGYVLSCSQNTLRNAVKRICEENDLPAVSPHGLRHSFASLCYHLRVPERICMEIGGWSDNQTMHKIYTHIAKSDVEHYTSELGSFFGTESA